MEDEEEAAVEEEAEVEETDVERVSIAELEAPVGIEVLEGDSDTIDPVVQAYSAGGSASTKFELCKE